VLGSSDVELLGTAVLATAETFALVAGNPICLRLRVVPLINLNPNAPIIKIGFIGETSDATTSDCSEDHTFFQRAVAHSWELTLV